MGIHTDNMNPPASDRIQVDGLLFMRCGLRMRIQGVTYGPFAPNAAGEPFPTPGRICTDFAQMRAIGINSVRTYHTPPAWFLELADAQGIAVLVDVPWPKHLCFLDSPKAQRQARQAVREAAEQGRGHPSLLAYSIGNEIPANIVRWHGAGRVQRFLSELTDVAKQADPAGLVTYANYPSTEYLELPFLDFATFNVYLHDPEAFRRYLFRLQNQIGDRPLLLGEIGMDTFRHDETEQAAFLAGHLREALLMGLAGAFVFAWTDDWHTGGHPIEDWAFGITRLDRSPKAAYYTVGEVFGPSPTNLLAQTPRVSIVVCSYNGAQTLDQCLQSLLALDYPDYEVILVDDGSTDNTREIAACYPDIRTIPQSNQGLSVARNVGCQAATGSIVAYTDSDCFADPYWLAHLVHQLQQSGAAAVGGPNLTPEDGWLAACVAASPGQPTHVLKSDQMAEHIPGCNMAFRREALQAIQGFQPKYRTAGDDVDVCWRLQQAGMWITFAPGAFVWHHRRQTPRTYLRQQAGYGEAEGLLWFDHPERFNSRGDGKWHGTMYGACLTGLRLSKPAIYRDTFASGLFQTLYQPGPAHWAMLPTTLEWHLVATTMVFLAFCWPLLGAAAAVMFGFSLLIASLQARQAPLAAPYRSLRSRLVVAALCYLQPLVRSWQRYRTRLFPPPISQYHKEVVTAGGARLSLNGKLALNFWDEAWRDRTELLEQITRYFSDHRWAIKVDSGWTDWDLEIYCHPWTILQICTAQEDHGSGKRLFRVRYRLRTSEYTRVLRLLTVLTTISAFCLRSLPMAAIATAFAGTCTVVWLRGIQLANQVEAIIHGLRQAMGLISCGKGP
jgi:GT2 family glycosyltransferase